MGVNMTQNSYHNVLFSDSSVVSMQQRLVLLKGKWLLFAGYSQSNPSLLSSDSSHSRVDGICSNSTVVVPVSGNLHVAIHAPSFTMTEKNHASHLVERTQDSGSITITTLVNTEPEAYLTPWSETAEYQLLRTKSYLRQDCENHNIEKAGYLSTHRWYRTNK